RPPCMNRHRSFEILDRHILERAHLDNPGTIDEHIDRPEKFHGGIDRFLHLLPVTHIARKGCNLCSCAGKFTHRSLEPVVMTADQCQSSSLFGQNSRHPQTQSPRSPGNEHCLVPEGIRGTTQQQPCNSHGAKGARSSYQPFRLIVHGFITTLVHSSSLSRN